MTGESTSRDIEKETIVVTTEDGIVLTGSRVQALEARLMHSLQGPFRILYSLLVLLFVMLFGLSLFLTRLSATVGHTENTVNSVTGPEARAAQARNTQGILDQMSCQDQKNLQKFVDNLVAAGFTQLGQLPSIVDPKCK